MKITKNSKNGEVKFYRDMEKGSLRKPDNNVENTAEIIGKLNLDKSFTGRILAPDSKRGKGNPFYEFVQSLTKEKYEKAPLDYLKIENCNNEDIRKFISPYGRRLTYVEDGSITLENLILDYGNKGTNREEVAEGLRKIQERIVNLQSYKKESLQKSFENNCIPFKIDENGLLQPATDKMKWLFGFLGKSGIDNEKFNRYEGLYQYALLEEKLNIICDNYFENTKSQGDILARKIYSEMQAYNKEVLHRVNIEDADERKGFSFYLNEIRDHYRKYFPPKSKKSKGRSGSKETRVSILNSRKNVSYFYSERYVLRQVRRRVTNQLVAGLIQCGKLYSYCEGDKWQEDMINSDLMQEIQVEEALKKHLFLSVIWSVNRLNHYFKYGGDNSQMLYAENVKGDILEELNGINFGDITYNQENENANNPVVKFIQGVKEDSAECQLLFNKLSVSFLLEESEKNPEYLLELLKEIFSNIYKVRLDIIHYRKGKLDFTSSVGENGKLEEQLHRDIESVQERFREQIRSTNILEYYPSELIENILTTSGLEFKLHPATLPMMPSFRKVYEKGSNLLKGDYSDENLKWYVDEKKNTESRAATLAYRNLLQLIYYHSFIPAVKSDMRLMTAFINRTIEWNKRKSIEKQSKSGKGHVNAHAYRYEGMPKYRDDTSLEEYMNKLQRAQSNKEKENLEAGIEKDESQNHYTSFVQDIIVFS